MSRSKGLAARFLGALRLFSGGTRKGDSPIFVRPGFARCPKLGQSPSRKMSQSRDDKEADILGWLEDGEEVEDEEKYWRKTAGRDRPATPEATADRTASVDRATGQETASGDAGIASARSAAESAATEGRSGPQPKTRLRKTLAVVSDLGEVVVGFFKSLRATDWLLLGAVVVLLVVVVTLVIPGALAFWKAVISVRKWPWWSWTCISLAVLGFLIWLRNRYE